MISVYEMNQTDNPFSDQKYIIIRVRYDNSQNGVAWQRFNRPSKKFSSHFVFAFLDVPNEENASDRDTQKLIVYFDQNQMF